MENTFGTEHHVVSPLVQDQINKHTLVRKFPEYLGKPIPVHRERYNYTILWTRPNTIFEYTKILPTDYPVEYRSR